MKKHLKNHGLNIGLLTVLLVLLVGGAYYSATLTAPAVAATPTVGAANAEAGSGGVTVNRMVYLTAAGTIATATSTTSETIGVCEFTAAEGAATRYAPAGTITTVSAGEAITVGDPLVAGSLGKAYVLDNSGLGMQRVAGFALTADAGTGTVSMIVCPHVVGPRSDPGGTAAVAADVLAIPVTATIVTKTTGGDGEALTLADGTPGQVLVITLATDGGGTGTLTPTTKTGFVSIAFADAGDTVALLFVDSTVGWVIVGSAGVAAPPAIALS